MKSEIDKDLAQSIEIGIESNCINPSRFQIQSLITIRELLLRLKLDAETAAMATDSQLREEAVEGLDSTYSTMYDMINRPLMLKLQPKKIVDKLRLYVVAGNRNARRTKRTFLEFNKNFTPPFKSEDFWKALGNNMLRKFDFNDLDIKELGIDLTALSKGVEDLISQAQSKHIRGRN